AFLAAGVSSSLAAVEPMASSATDSTSWLGLEQPLISGKIRAAGRLPLFMTNWRPAGTDRRPADQCPPRFVRPSRSSAHAHPMVRPGIVSPLEELLHYGSHDLRVDVMGLTGEGTVISVGKSIGDRLRRVEHPYLDLAAADHERGDRDGAH